MQRLAGRGGDDGQNEQYHGKITHLISRPGRPEQILEQRTVIKGFELLCQSKGQGADNAPDDERHAENAQQTAHGAVFQKVLDKLAPRAIAAGNDQGLKDNTWNKVFLKSFVFHQTHLFHLQRQRMRPVRDLCRLTAAKQM